MTLFEVNDFIRHKGRIVGVHVTVEIKNNVGVAIIRGMIDTYNASYVQDILNIAIQLDGIKYFVVDLTEVNYLSSTGIGLFVDILKKCKRISVEFCILRLSAKIKEIFDLLGFTTFFHFLEKIEDIK